MPDEVEILNLLQLRQHGFVHKGFRKHILDNFDSHLLLLHLDLVLSDVQTLLVSLTEP